MPAEYSRTERLSEQIKQRSGLAHTAWTEDPRLGIVAVNFCDLSRDLSYADVNVTVMVPDESDEKIVRVLRF